MRLRIGLATEAPALAIFAALAAFTAWIAPRAPYRMPVHWDLRGVPDAFGSRFEALAVPPVVMLLVYLLLRWAPSLAGQARDARFAHAYHVFRHGILAVFALVHGVLCARAVGLRVPDALPIAAALLAIALLTLRLVARARASRRSASPH